MQESLQSTVFLQSIYAIYNDLDGLRIYDFGDPTKIGTITNNVLTLLYDTTSMSASDPLIIRYDDQITLGIDTPMKVQDDSISLLKQIVYLLESSGNVDVANRQRVIVDALTAGMTLATVSTITNAVPVGNVATLASYDHRQFAELWDTAFNTGIRSKLIFA